MKKNYRMKKTISMKQFVCEFGDAFSEHMKERLLELGKRCILTRKEYNLRFDIKHVEHTMYDCLCSPSDDLPGCKKEHVYGQLIINEGVLYFSDKCRESTDVIQVPVVDEIYDTLVNREMLLDEGIRGKIVDDSNIDFIINSIQGICPAVTPEYLAIISRYVNTN